MKSSFLLVGLLTLISIVSCKKDTTEAVKPNSEFTALKDNSEWISTSSWASYSVKNKTFTIAGSKEDAVTFQAEILHFIFKEDDITKSDNNIIDVHAAWNLVVGGDLIIDTYVVDSSYTNSVTITSLDTTSKQISGTFLVKLTRDKHFSDSSETMLYKQGFFDLKYEEFD